MISEAQQTTIKPNLGFLGLGWIGRSRLEAIVRESCANPVSIAEPLEENARIACEIAPNATRVKSLDELLSDPGLDGVVIATPSAQHAHQAICSLEAGKAVFCQKPLARTADETRAIVEAAKNSDLLLGVDFSYRYTAAMQSLYPLISDGKLGKIYAIDLAFHNAYGPDKKWFYDFSQSGGGCVIDLGIHMIDLALWVLDFPGLVNVDGILYCKGERILSPARQVEDYGMAWLETETGVSIHLQCSWNLPAGQDAVIEARFYGTEGGAAFRNVEGSFYDFIAERYDGTRKTVLAAPPDEWSGRAVVVWAEKLAHGARFNAEECEQFIKTAHAIDRIYGR